MNRISSPWSHCGGFAIRAKRVPTNVYIVEYNGYRYEQPTTNIQIVSITFINPSLHPHPRPIGGPIFIADSPAGATPAAAVAHYACPALAASLVERTPWDSTLVVEVSLPVLFWVEGESSRDCP